MSDGTSMTRSHFIGWGRTVFGVFVALGLVPGCDHTHVPASSTSSTTAAGFSSVRDGIVAEMLVAMPSLGRQLGLHDYDGKLPDYSGAGFVHLRDALQKWRRLLSQVKESGLTPNETLDLGLLKFAIDSELFKIVDLDAAHKRPDYYTGIFDVPQYIDDEDAPLEVRLQRTVLHEEAALVQAPHVLENVHPPLSKAITRWQMGVYRGVASYLRDDVPKRFVGIGNQALRDRFSRVNLALASQAERIATALEGWSATGDGSHVLGLDGYRRFLLAEEGITMPLVEFKRMGEENLRANQKAYEELSATTTLVRPSPSEELASATDMVEETRNFVVAHHIVTLPNGERPVPVRESPPYFHSSGAMLAGAGKSAVYFITSPDPSLPAAEQRDYVMPFGVLRTNTVHEVYPGHYVQSLWADHAPTLAQRFSFNVTFSEGWAHYAEQMMLEEGLGADDPQNRLGQLREALRRNCRYLASIGMHTEGMTLAQAEDLFGSRCHQDRATARQNAERGEYDPGYFSYTLGKIEILALRDEVKRRLGNRFSLERFHNALLAHGRPPVPLLRPILMRELGITP